MKVIVDVREQEFIRILNEKREQYPDIHFEYASLALGDIEVYEDDKLLYVWERKTLQDLLASIKDGRYKEQSHRLTHIHGPSKVLYLVEGIMNQLSSSEKQLVNGAMTSLIFHKCFRVWRSVHIHDSVETFLLICNKLHKEKHRFLGSHVTSGCEPSTYVEHVKQVKKDNITRENIGEMFLCQIPDISVVSAKAIMKFVEGDFAQLIQIVRDCPDKLEQIKINGSKPRKLSKNVLGRLRQFLEV